MFGMGMGFGSIYLAGTLATFGTLTVAGTAMAYCRGDWQEYDLTTLTQTIVASAMWPISVPLMAMVLVGFAIGS